MSTLSPSDPAYRYDDPTSAQEADEDYEHSALPSSASGAPKRSEGPASPALSGASRTRSRASLENLSSGESSGIGSEPSTEEESSEKETDVEARALEEDLLDAEDVAAGQPTRKEWVMNALSKGGRSRGQSYTTVGRADADESAARSSRSRRSAGSGGVSSGAASAARAGRSSSSRKGRKGTLYNDLASGGAAGAGLGAGGADPAALEKGFGGDPDFSSTSVVKKAWYKKWWVWILIVVALIAIICGVAAAVVASNANYQTDLESLFGNSTSSSVAGSAVLGWITSTADDGQLTSVLGTITNAGSLALNEAMVVTHGASSLYASVTSYNDGAYTPWTAATTTSTAGGAAAATGTTTYNNGAYTPWTASTGTTLGLAATELPTLGGLMAAVSTDSSLQVATRVGVSLSASTTLGLFTTATATTIATATGTAAFAFQTLTGTATYFDSSHHFTTCGGAPSDSDYVLALPTSEWSTAQCNEQVVVTNLANGLSVNVWVSEECAYCEQEGVDLSQAAFEAISGGGLAVGAMQVAWGFVGTNSEAGAMSFIPGASPTLAPTSDASWAVTATATTTPTWWTATTTSSSSVEPTIYIGTPAQTMTGAAAEGYTAAVVGRLSTSSSSAEWAWATTTTTTPAAWSATTMSSVATATLTATTEGGNTEEEAEQSAGLAQAAAHSFGASSSSSSSSSSASASATISWSLDNIDS